MKYLMIAALLLAAAGCAPTGSGSSAPTVDTAEQLLARGDYLVNNVVLCGDCHTPHGPQGPDMSKQLHGTTLPMAPTAPIPFATVAPPIAGLPTGYTEEQFVHFLQTGERPSGVPVMPPMPPYRLNEGDARAVAAYIASLPKATP